MLIFFKIHSDYSLREVFLMHFKRNENLQLISKLKLIIEKNDFYWHS